MSTHQISSHKNYFYIQQSKNITRNIISFKSKRLLSGTGVGRGTTQLPKLQVKCGDLSCVAAFALICLSKISVRSRWLVVSLWTSLSSAVAH